jgi:hypothetical protein
LTSSNLRVAAALDVWFFTSIRRKRRLKPYGH